jgi:hypothetical protein
MFKGVAFPLHGQILVGLIVVGMLAAAVTQFPYHALTQNLDH